MDEDEDSRRRRETESPTPVLVLSSSQEPSPDDWTALGNHFRLLEDKLIWAVTFCQARLGMWHNCHDHIRRVRLDFHTVKEDLAQVLRGQLSSVTQTLGSDLEGTFNDHGAHLAWYFGGPDAIRKALAIEEWKRVCGILDDLVAFLDHPVILFCVSPYHVRCCKYAIAQFKDKVKPT
jgi:hypothetical protein